MSTDDAKLLSKIFEITRGDLENAVFPFPDASHLLDSMTFIRIARIGRFWTQREGEERMILEGSMIDLIAGLHGQSCPWMFLIRGHPNRIECWFGVQKNSIEGSSFRSILTGMFPDIRLDDKSSIDRSKIAYLSYATCLTGTPSQKSDTKANTRTDQIEKLCRGLYGSTWAYYVYAKPVHPVETTKLINMVSGQIRDVHASYLLKTSAIDEQNRVAKRYIELLEAKLKKLEHGRAVGMWSPQVVVLAESPSTLGRAHGLLQSAFSGEQSLPDPIRIRPCAAEANQLVPMEYLTSTEVGVLAHPPREDYPGYEVIEYARFGVELNNSFLGTGRSIKIGEIIDRGMSTGNSFQIPLRDLTRHGLIVGVTGSGKTNTCFLMLEQLWDQGRGIPFLVIESAKSEYRGLLKNPNFMGPKIFTVGDETCSPLRLNPFEVPEGILIQTHIDYLKSLFSAAFVLYPPMPYVLEQSIQEVYVDRGWDVARNNNCRGNATERLYPTLADLSKKISVVVDRMGYDERITMDVKAGLIARINQLQSGGGKGLMLNTRKSVSSEILFESPCILELKQIVSDDEKAFLIGLILIRLYEHHEAKASPVTDELRHVTLIEEAHRLLRNVSIEQGNDVSANPKGRAIEVFSNILSEIRAYGEGILMAEQIPLKLTPDAVKNSSLKIIHRLVAEDDRKVVGNTMNLNESQMRYLATLRAGEGVAYAEGMQKPVLLGINLSVTKEGTSEITKQEVSSAMDLFWRDSSHLMTPYAGCYFCPPAQRSTNCTMRNRLISDELLSGAFRRLFNAVRLNLPSLFDAYTDFKLLHQRDPWSSSGINLIYCSLVELVESEVERRGEFWGWTYEVVENTIKAVCAVLFHLSEYFGKSERSDLLQKIGNDLDTMAQGFRNMHRIGIFPFVGCRFCLEPCQYRYDMSYPSHDLDVKDFRSICCKPDFQSDVLAQVCWNAAGRAFPNDDRARCGAAFCFGVQQLSELGLTRSDQEEAAFQVADLLTAKREGSYGQSA